MTKGRQDGAFPGWLARRRYRLRLKRQLAAKLAVKLAAASAAPAPAAPLPALAGAARLWAILADPGSNVVPLRRGATSAAERD